MPGSPGASGAGGSAAQGAPVTEIKTGVISPLQEDESRYYATAVVKKTKEQLNLATVEWPKEPVESWRARVENQLPKVMAAVTSNYTLPTISEGAGCVEDTWTATNGPPDARSYHTAIWTGTEMIVWGRLHPFQYGRQIDPWDRQLDTYQHDQCACCPGWPYGSLDWNGSHLLGWPR